MLALTVLTVNTYLARWLAFIPAPGAMQFLKYGYAVHETLY